MRFFTAAAFFVTTAIVILVNPAEGGPVAEAFPKADPEGGDLLDLELLLSIDLSGLGDLLNEILKVVLGIGKANKCEYDDYAAQLQGLLLQLNIYLKLLGIEVEVNLLILLGPLIQAVLDLVAALLGGLLIDLSIVINLVLNLLVTLNLGLDLDVALQLGNLLNVDVEALLKLG